MATTSDDHSESLSRVGDPTPGVPGMDTDGLAAYLDRTAPGLRHGPLTVRLLSGGRSNLTYAVTDGEHEWVLRRPPLGHVLETAHDMSREYRVLSALAATDVPVPATVSLCPGAEVLGAPFYLMEFTAGPIYRNTKQLEGIPAAQAEMLADELVDVLTRLHDVNAESVGLGDLGRPTGYLDRQVRRWKKQVESSRSRKVPGLHELADRLALSIPATQRTAIVHGDYRLDNVVFDAAEPAQIRAVLDWEMATLGDPLTDIASTIMWWDGITGLNSPIAAVPGEAAGFPTRNRLLERYANLTGLDLSPMPWYVAFSFYKIAAIFEGIYYRHVQGLAVGDGFDQLAGMVGELVSRGHDALDNA